MTDDADKLPANYLEVRVMAHGAPAELLQHPPRLIVERARQADKLLMVPLASGAVLAQPLLHECCAACKHSRPWQGAAFVGWCELHGGHVPSGGTCTAWEAS